MQVFLMFYLTDTSRENGCLRVVPGQCAPSSPAVRRLRALTCTMTACAGSHLKTHPIDSLLPQNNAKDRAFRDPLSPEFGAAEGEVDVPLRVGDFVAGYSEILHSAHANTSEHKRTCLTMWYYPAFTELPGRTQASIADAEGAMEHGLSQVRSPEVAAKLAPMEIRFDGRESPYEQSWNMPRL